MKLQFHELIELSYFLIAEVEDLLFSFTPYHYSIDVLPFRNATVLSLTELGCKTTLACNWLSLHEHRKMST